MDVEIANNNGADDFLTVFALLLMERVNGLHFSLDGWTVP